jgi:two-component system response regulator HydG
MKKILIVEDDLTFCLMLRTWLGKQGFAVESAPTVNDAKQKMSTTNYDIILSDLRLPDDDGINLLKWAKERKISTPFIILTSYAKIQSAVECMKIGAKDYIPKPIKPELLFEKMDEVLKQQEAEKRKVAQKGSAYIMGNSLAIKRLHEMINRVASTEMTVFISGEPGTGKKQVARLIHEKSARKERPFIIVHCGEIPKEEFSKKLFGQITPMKEEPGFLTNAMNGVIFFENVDEMPLKTQEELLFALKVKRIKMVGSNTEKEINVRVIASSSENLYRLIRENKFSEDFHRYLNEVSLQVPSLRDRSEDISLFAESFLEEANEELEKKIIGFDEESMRILNKCQWSGNLRQMKSVVKRAAMLCEDKYIKASHLPDEIIGETGDTSDNAALHNEEYEKRKIMKALEACNNNKSKAAIMLKIDRKTLYNKMKHYNME